MALRKKRRPPKRRRPQEWIGYLLIAAVPVAVIAVALFPSSSPQPPATWTRTTAQTSIHATVTRPKTAAILDQLSVYSPNENLITTVQTYLTRAGYRVEIFSAEEITVDLYRQLPSKGYGVIILRVHSTATVEVSEGRTVSGAPVYLLTGEPYNRLSYSYDQLMGFVRPVRIDAGTFFGIGPDFVTRRMEGAFPDTLIILAGCESLRNIDMAKALVARGASNVIGWSDSVELEHNDKAIASLAKTLFERGLSPKKAIQATMDEVGSDPSSHSQLLCYP